MHLAGKIYEKAEALLKITVTVSLFSEPEFDDGILLLCRRDASLKSLPTRFNDHQRSIGRDPAQVFGNHYQFILGVFIVDFEFDV